MSVDAAHCILPFASQSTEVPSARCYLSPPAEQQLRRCVERTCALRDAKAAPLCLVSGPPPCPLSKPPISELRVSLPGSILFCCDHNSVRSPMVEALMKKLYGRGAYVQSAASCMTWKSTDSSLRSATKSVSNLPVTAPARSKKCTTGKIIWTVSPSGCAVASKPAPGDGVGEGRLSRRRVLANQGPTGLTEGRDATLSLYRTTRDEILAKLVERFGPPPRR